MLIKKETKKPKKTPNCIFKRENKGKMNYSLETNSTVSNKDLRLDNN